MIVVNIEMSLKTLAAQAVLVQCDTFLIGKSASVQEYE